VRLAVFTNKYPARVATFFERDMRALLESGVEIDVFAIHPLDAGLWRYSLDLLGERVLPRNRVHHLGLGQSLRRAWAGLRRSPARGIHDAAAVALHAGKSGPAPLAKTAYVLPKAWAWAAAHAGRFDHVLAYWGNYAGTCAYVFHRLAGRPIPFSLWLHAGTDLYYRPVFLRPKLLYADRIITCCEFNRRYVLDRYPDVADRIADKIHVSYHGLDLSSFPYRPDGRPPHTVVAVGRLARDKGFAFLLRAAHELARRGIAVEVELVGDGAERGALERLARQLGIASRVRFRGWLPFHDARAAMGRATVLVHPSDGLGDGLPNVLREAMALGTPVIASRVAGIPEALDDGRCGILVPPRDVPALAHAIATLLADADLRRRLAARGRWRTETHFDMWRNGARLAEVLRAARRPGDTLRPQPDPQPAEVAE
jgi:glycosyltransferase involved in cell wall biosynthesis